MRKQVCCVSEPLNLRKRISREHRSFLVFGLHAINMHIQISLKNKGRDEEKLFVSLRVGSEISGGS